MIARKNKAKKALAEERSASARTAFGGKTDRGREEHFVELGKFFIDIAKLILGGVIITALLDNREHRMPILASAIAATILLVSLGVKIIKSANSPKTR